MDVDKPGKDSYELRKAGAAQTMVASNQRWALMTETPDEAPLDLAYLVSRMDHSTLDLVLVEGFKHEAVAKILLFRNGAGHDVSELTLDEHVIAVASDAALTLEVPVLDLNNVEGLQSLFWRGVQSELPGDGFALPGLPFFSKQTQKAILPDGLFTCLMPGSSLLSHGETPHYHRRYGVSLLSSAWGQVGPPR